MTWLDGSWDTATLDGVLLPGRVARLDVMPLRDIAREKAENSDTPHLRDGGYGGATIELDIELWRAAMFPELEGILTLISPQQPGKVLEPRQLVHPITVANNVVDVFYQSHKLPMPSNGRLLCTVTFGHWLPPEKKIPRSPPGGGGKPKDKMTDEEIAELLRSVQYHREEMEKIQEEAENGGFDPPGTHWPEGWGDSFPW